MRINMQDMRSQHLRRARAQSLEANHGKIDELSQEFEAQFIAQMMENMFATIPVNNEMGGGDAEEVYRSLLVNEYGKLVARTGGVGVADHVKREMLRLQEARNE